MRSRLSLLLSATLALVACGGTSSPEGSDTTKFLGKWVYEPGSTIALACPSQTTQTIDLSMMPPTNQPGFFTFSAGAGASEGSEALHEVDARGCQYDWTVSGDVATAAAGQSCASFPDGHGGSQVVHLESGTKSTMDGATMSVTVQFATEEAGCSATVHGTARRSP